MKDSPAYAALRALAALVGTPDAIRRTGPPLADLERELWTAFTTPLSRGDLAAVGYALARLCAESDALTAGGRALSRENQALATLICALVESLPRLIRPGEVPDSAAFRTLVHAKAPRGEQSFRRAAEAAWETCIRAALGGI